MTPIGASRPTSAGAAPGAMPRSAASLLHQLKRQMAQPKERIKLRVGWSWRPPSTNGLAAPIRTFSVVSVASGLCDFFMPRLIAKAVQAAVALRQVPSNELHLALDL